MSNKKLFKILNLKKNSTCTIVVHNETVVFITLLYQAAAPKRWKAYDGRYTEMDTQYTIRAREMKDIYNSINMKFLTQDERLDILLTLKHTVKVSCFLLQINIVF